MDPELWAPYDEIGACFAQDAEVGACKPDVGGATHNITTQATNE